MQRIVHCLVVLLVAGISRPALAQKMCATSGVAPKGGFSLTGVKNKFWKGKSRLRVSFLNGTSFLRSKVRRYADEWTDYANIKFDYVADGGADIRIEFATDGFSWSMVGTDARSVRRGKATMHFGWFTRSTRESEFRRTILHEFGHALGFAHEHQNPRGKKIPWNKPAVYRHFAKQGWDKAKVDHNIFRTLSQDSVHSSRFDKYSIMLYSVDNKLTTGNFEIKGNTRLSSTDKNYASKFYPFPPYSIVRIDNKARFTLPFQFKWEGDTKWTSASVSSGGTWWWRRSKKGGRYRSFVLIRFDADPVKGKRDIKTMRLTPSYWRPSSRRGYPLKSDGKSYLFKRSGSEVKLYKTAAIAPRFDASRLAGRMEANPVSPVSIWTTVLKPEGCPCRRCSSIGGIHKSGLNVQ